MRGLKSSLGLGSALAGLGAPIKGAGVQTFFGATKVGGSASISATFAQKTYNLFFKVRRPIKGRVRLHKYGLGASSGIKASIAPSATVASLTVPSGGLAALKPFVFQIPSHPAGTGSTASDIPAKTISDWLDFETVPRTDGGTGYLIMIRVYEDAASVGNRVVMALTQPANSTDFETYGWYNSVCLANGDNTLTSATFTSNSSGPPIMLEFETNVVGKTVSWNSDSTGEGRDAFGLRTHNGMRLAIDDLNYNGGFNLDYFNQGWSSANTAGGTGTPPAVVKGYWGQYLKMLEGMQKLPDVACFQPASVNNGGWNLADCNYWCDTFIAWAAANAVIPVLVTPLPVTQSDPPSAAVETARMAIVNGIIAKATAAGIRYVDRNAPLNNSGSSTGGFLDPADTSDGTHLTAAGVIKERDYAVRGWKAVFATL